MGHLKGNGSQVGVNGISGAPRAATDTDVGGGVGPRPTGAGHPSVRCTGRSAASSARAAGTSVSALP